MSTFGADALFLAPEYLGNVNGVSMAIVGATTGVFIMSWNVTTFILHSNQVKFLATTSKPFLKYCINNASIPLLFLLFYLGKTIYFDVHNELLTAGEIIVLISGFFTGTYIHHCCCILIFFQDGKIDDAHDGTRVQDPESVRKTVWSWRQTFPRKRDVEGRMVFLTPGSN